LTEMFFDQALVRAQELDRHLAETGKPVGPLHGIPVSLKDSFKVKKVFIPRWAIFRFWTDHRCR
jgi:Asp-tRNA(Asn)/Glu-tRNA(Gln) amidotransferase A subunit family amidase